MKRHIYILALAIASLLTASCDKEIGMVDFNEQPRLIINSLMTANDTANFVELNLTGNAETKPVKGAQVRIFVNGSLSEEITSDSSTYMIKSQFESGDKVKIEAKTDKYEASAEVVVRASRNGSTTRFSCLPPTIQTRNAIRFTKPTSIFIPFRLSSMLRD